MKLYGLIGYPLTHSFSAAYFTQKFEEMGLKDHEYRNFPLKHIEDFQKLVSSESDLRGLNVTIPYKEAVIPFLEDTSEEAEAIGAVNTICFTPEGHIGHNTDWIGFKESLVPLLSLWQKPPHALILGWGGGAKAVAYALAMLNIPFTRISRTAKNAGIRYEDISDDLIAQSHLIINTTPLGMASMTHAAPDLNFEAVTKDHLLYDLIYNPTQTLFLSKGTEQGAHVKNGLEMLHLQAEASWALWQRQEAGFNF